MRSGLGLKGPAWPYLRFHESKLRAIMEYAGKRFWAWVDDEPDGQTIIGQRGMIVTPDPKVGLTDGQVKALLTFASQLRFVNSSN
jgi:hypothetical protein